MKISVVMASYLGEYPNAATNRKEKFKRAVQSFIDQPYPDKELVIVSDGCEITLDCIHDLFGGWLLPTNVDVIFQPKDELFSGITRNRGWGISTGDIICYLDTDDILFGNHLGNIVDAFDKDTKWVYYNDFVAMSSDLSKKRERVNIISEGRIGTSSIAHNRNVRFNGDVNWPDGYGHDWKFIEMLNNKFPNPPCIKACGYLVCHIPGQCDF